MSSVDEKVPRGGKNEGEYSAKRPDLTVTFRCPESESVMVERYIGREKTTRKKAFLKSERRDETDGT